MVRDLLILAAASIVWRNCLECPWELATGVRAKEPSTEGNVSFRECRPRLAASV